MRVHYFVIIVTGVDAVSKGIRKKGWNVKDNLTKLEQFVQNETF